MITERVPTGRRGPLAVGLVALALVALLAWKPWAAPAPVATLPSPIAARPTAPTLSPSPTAVASATPSPARPTPALPPPPTPTPTPTPTPAVVGVTLATVTDPLTASVHCRYVTDHDGVTVLKRIKVAAPIVVVTDAAAAARVRRVAWRARLEVNRLETLFSADWESVDESARQFALALPGDPLSFRQMTVHYTHPMGPTLVVRVVLVVEWFAFGGINLGSTSIVATTYAHGDEGPIRPEGCHTLTG